MNQALKWHKSHKCTSLLLISLPCLPVSNLAMHVVPFCTVTGAKRFTVIIICLQELGLESIRKQHKAAHDIMIANNCGGRQWSSQLNSPLLIQGTRI